MALGAPENKNSGSSQKEEARVDCFFKQRGATEDAGFLALGAGELGHQRVVFQMHVGEGVAFERLEFTE